MDYASEVRRLLAESEKEQYQRPGMLSLAFNHPGLASYATKTQEQYENDMRRHSWLEKVAALRDQANADGRHVGLGDIHPALAEAVDRRGELNSPYINRGVLANGQPTRQFLDWMGSIGSTALNTGRAAVGVDGAGSDLAESTNTLAVGIPYALSGTESAPYKAWKQEQAVPPVESLQFTANERERPSLLNGRLLPRNQSLMYEGVASKGMTTGDNVLEEAGMDDTILRRVLGAGIDVVTSPPHNLMGGARSLVRGQVGNAAKIFAKEAALPGTWLAITEAARKNLADQGVGQ